MRFLFLKNSITKKIAMEFFRLRKAIPRSILAMRYLRGNGIEIGALHNPVFLGKFGKVKYVDRMSVLDLKSEYPELRDFKLVDPDVIDNGEILDLIEETSQDFIIANHFIEHCEDPIQTIKNFTKKIKPGGVLYLAVPDKRFTFDKDRLTTEFQHLLNDHNRGVHISRKEHYLEWVACFHKGEDLDQKADELMARSYSIHFHVWTDEEFLKFLNLMIDNYKVPIKVIDYFSVADEAVFILKKAEN